TLFPYTTLFRSVDGEGLQAARNPPVVTRHFRAVGQGVLGQHGKVHGDAQGRSATSRGPTDCPRTAALESTIGTESESSGTSNCAGRRLRNPGPFIWFVCLREYERDLVSPTQGVTYRAQHRHRTVRGSLRV